MFQNARIKKKNIPPMHHHLSGNSERLCSSTVRNSTKREKHKVPENRSFNHTARGKGLSKVTMESFKMTASSTSYRGHTCPYRSPMTQNADLLRAVLTVHVAATPSS